MASLVENVKEILSIKLKTRYDSLSDQYSRIFLVKVTFISTLFLGFSWYSDKISCIVPDNLGLSSAFVSEACWVQGFYIYETVVPEKDTVAYYGIPTNLDYDGRLEDGKKFCISNPPRDVEVDPDCVEMEKTFFLQYQYMPFFVASLSLLYYLPYLFFKIINTDLAALKTDAKTSEDTEKIFQTYFCRTSRTHLNRMRIRVTMNFIIKMVYIFSNLSAFFIMDQVFNGRFLVYGLEWFNWIDLPNQMAYDYMGKRGSPKPGDVIMPTFGICEIHEGARDARATITNKHKFICEYSQNVLYHYVLVMLWFVFIIGIAVSTCGWLWHSLELLYVKTRFCEQIGYDRSLGDWLTYREYEYLKILRNKNIAMYHEVLNRLLERKRTSTSNDVTYASHKKLGKADNGFV